MVTNPQPDPLDQEIQEIMAANPGLLEQLQELDRKYDRGELRLIDHAEVGRRLRALGVPLDDPQD